MHVFGIDVGGSGIKGAIVDVVSGKLITERKRLPTPPGAKPEEVAKVINDLLKMHGWTGPVGVGFPSVVISGVIHTAANIDSGWIGINGETYLHEVTGCPVYALNDADAAGLAEMNFGSGREYQKGVVLVLTLGTGIGSAIFTNGVLLPNTEFGHLIIRGKDAEKRASAAVRVMKKLSYKQYAKRLQEYLSEMEKLISPDVIIIGGGISKDSAKFFPYLSTRAKLITAHFLNHAGVIGAAYYAGQCSLASQNIAGENSAVG